MDGGAWWATVHEIAKSRTRLSNFTFTFTCPFTAANLSEGRDQLLSSVFPSPLQGLLSKSLVGLEHPGRQQAPV